MKLSKFKKNQLSVAKLKGLKGGVSGSDDSIETVDGGSSHTTRRSTSSTGSDHDSGRHDSD
jgi:hypothetical protein